MAVVLTAKDASDWTYRGVGAVNLVLAYAGSSPEFVSFCLYFNFLRLFFCSLDLYIVNLWNIEGGMWLKIPSIWGLGWWN